MISLFVLISASVCSVHLAVTKKNIDIHPFRFRYRPNHPDRRGDGHHCRCKGCWERQSHLQSVDSWWSGAGCGCGGERRRNIWHLLHCSGAGKVCHHHPFWRRKHPQQPIPRGGESLRAEWRQMFDKSLNVYRFSIAWCDKDWQNYLHPC